MKLQPVENSNVEVSIREPAVALLELNRVHKRNALSQALLDDLAKAMHELDLDTNVRAVVLTSSGESPFCAGADLNDLAQLTTAGAHQHRWLQDLESCFSGFRKPVVAAIRGFAFGGGFEMALMCDMILASSDARVGFPEIRLGTIPGAGGTQRLTKALGKQKAMELILTGLPTTVVEMERYGVVNRVCPIGEDVVEEALKVAKLIAGYSAPAIAMGKQSIKAAEATSLSTGLELERALYYSTFDLMDCREGVAAFLEKREPKVSHC